MCVRVNLVTVGSSSAFIFWETRSGCTVLVDVPLTPIDPYYKAELFPSLDAKLAANQNRFDRDLHQGKNPSHFNQNFEKEKTK